MKKYLRISAFAFCIAAVLVIVITIVFAIIGIDNVKAPRWSFLAILLITANLIIAGLINLFFQDV